MIRGEALFERACRRPKMFTFAHPDVPRDWPGFLVGHRAAGHLECQLQLTVMVAFMPEHVLEQEDGVVVVNVHVPACLHSAL